MRKVRVLNKLPKKCKKCENTAPIMLAADSLFSCEICKRETLTKTGEVAKICKMCAANNKQCGFCLESTVKIKVAKAPKEKKYRKHSIIKRIVLAPAKSDKFFWPREMATFIKLLAIYPNINFWKLAPIKTVSSLIYFFKSEKPYLDNMYKIFHYVPEKKEVEIKIGEKEGNDYNPSKKIKTVKEFLSK